MVFHRETGLLLYGDCTFYYIIQGYLLLFYINPKVCVCLLVFVYVSDVSFVVALGAVVGVMFYYY